MSDDGKLVFHVKGSAPSPYRILAEGTGVSLRVFCGCPAGRKGGKFCKHVAAILEGDVTNLISGHDDVEELTRRAAGTAYQTRAREHPVDDPLEARCKNIETLEEAVSEFGQVLRDLGWHIELTATDGSPPYELSRKQLALRILQEWEPSKSPYSYLGFCEVYRRIHHTDRRVTAV